MSDFNCSYCNQEWEADYDDEDFFTEGSEIEYECGACERKFLVSVSITINYDTECIEHDWGPYKRWTDNPSPDTQAHFDKMDQHSWCQNCDKCGDLEDISPSI